MGNVMGKLAASHKWALGIVLFTTVAILAGVNWRIFKFEQLLNHGQVVRFALAPVDPRSLMQGDYMALEYAIARDVRSALAPQQMQGQLLLALDGQKVARFMDFILTKRWVKISCGCNFVFVVIKSSSHRTAFSLKKGKPIISVRLNTASLG